MTHSTLPIRLSCILVLLAMFSACSMTNTHYDATKAHHTPEGFKNRYSEGTGGLSNFLRWQWERFGKTIAAPVADLSVITPDLKAIAKPNGAQTTWIGHSSNLVQMNGFAVLTDPVFSDRAAPVSFAGPKRHQAPGLSISQLPAIDAVVISHNHYDHLDLASARALAALPNAPTFYVPLGVDVWFKDHVPQAKVLATDWQDTHTVTKAGQTLKLQLLPVQHWSSRTPFDRSATLWGSWAMSTAEKSVWFSGDLGYSKDTADIGKQFPKGFDLALIAVGAYEPRWFMKGQHINPAEAVTIHTEISARKSIGIHWGTFSLTDEPLDQAISDLAQALTEQGVPKERFLMLRPGQTTAF